MSDMRLIVAGAGGRMGRTLIKAIADRQGGAARPARSKTPRSPLIGRGCRLLAGLRANGVKLVRRRCGRCRPGRRHRRDFTVPAATLAWQHRRQARHGPRHRHHRLVRGGRSRDQGRRQAAVIVKSGNMSLGVNLLAALVKRVAKTLDESPSTSNRRDASQQEESMRRPAPRCCSAARRRKAAASISIKHSVRAATATPARGKPAISALPRCAAARWSASTR